MLRDVEYEKLLQDKGSALGDPLSSNQLVQPSVQSADVACSGISANTNVVTSRGRVAARNLRIGDNVRTAAGSATLRWVGFCRGSDNAFVRLADKTGIRGSTMLTPDHLVMVSPPKSEELFGVQELLCPARHLASVGKASLDTSANPMIVHMLFDQFELVECAGGYVQSFSPDMTHIRARDPQTARDIINALPRLASLQGQSSYVQSRPVINEREARLLFA